MLLSAVMCAKPLRHRNVNIKLYINQIYVNTIIQREKIYLLKKKKVKGLLKIESSDVFTCPDGLY